MSLDFSKRDGAQTTTKSLEAGEYTATVAGAEEVVSRNGHPMLVVDYDVDTGGRTKRLTCWHLIGHASGDESKYMWSIDLLRDAFGPIKGDVDQLVGKRVNVAIKMEQWTDSEGNDHVSPKVDRVLPFDGEEDDDDGDWG